MARILSASLALVGSTRGLTRLLLLVLLYGPPRLALGVPPVDVGYLCFFCTPSIYVSTPQQACSANPLGTGVGGCTFLGQFFQGAWIKEICECVDQNGQPAAFGNARHDFSCPSAAFGQVGPGFIGHDPIGSSGFFFASASCECGGVDRIWDPVTRGCVPFTRNAVRDKNVGPPQTCVANPINPANGNKYHRETIYRGSGPFPLALDLHYSSLGQPTDPRGQPVAKGWRHSYQRGVSLVNAGAPNETALAWREDGRILYFDKVGVAYVADAEVADRLERVTDANGRFVGWRLVTAGHDELESYDVNGRLATISNRAGMTLTLSYSDLTTPLAVAPRQDLLTRVEDSFGRSFSLRYDAAGRVAAVTDPSGAETQFSYDSQANLAALAYPDQKSRTLHYEISSFPFALTGITDENGARFATYAYDQQGRAILSEHAGSAERTELSFSDSGTTAVTTYVSSTLPNTRTYGFEQSHGAFRNTSVSGPGCAACQYSQRAHDSNGNLLTARDWNGNLTEYEYDLGRNLETKRIEAMGTAEQRTIWTEWHPFYRLPVRIAEPLRITTYLYGAPTDPTPGNAGSLLSKTVQVTSDATGAQGFAATTVGTPRIWTYTYNHAGQVLSVDGPRTDVSDVTTYTYHPNDDPDPGKRGNIATITNALGHVTQIAAYDAHGKPLTIVDANGLTTTLTYDPRQRLTSRNVGGQLTSYEYDGVGQLTRVTLPDGSFLAYTHDAAHRLTQIADSLGNRILYTLDLAGNRIREDVFDPAGALAQTRGRVYSALNRLEQEIGGTNPATQLTRYAYDNQGNLTSITDPLNRVTVNSYDALNRLKQITDPANGATRYAYDGLDQLTRVTDPRNNPTSYALDGLGNLSARSSPDTGDTTAAYDAAGNLVSSTDAKSQSTTYRYDALNRVTQIVHSQATGSQLLQVDYSYDQGANGLGRLASITETSAAGAALSAIQYGYDQQGRVTSETRTIAGASHTTAYAYDAAGRMVGMTYPSGRAMSHGLDGLGRVTRIETTGAGETRVILQDVTYHPFGPAKAFTFGNLQAYARSFDQDGRITSHTLANQTKALSFDAAGRITGIAEQGNSANTQAYGYDLLDRLTNAVLPASTFAYGYDAVGNRLSKTTGGVTDTYSYPATGNRLTLVTGTSGTRTYAHDPNGAITTDGVNTYGYDARGRLVSATSAAGTTGFQVNALGQRVRRTSALGDTVFHYDLQGRLIAESSLTGTPIREYVWLADQPVAVADHTQAGGGCAANPTLDMSNSFVPFARRERMEVHSGRPGERGWEWGLGTNTRDFDATARADLDWVSGKPYGFVLTYDGAGNARVTVRDGTTELFTLTWTGGLDVGNALRFMVKSPAGIGVGNRISVLVTSIDGQPVADALATAGNNAFSEVERVYAGASLRDGYGVEGTVTFTFAGNYPPRGNQLDFTVTAGNVTCEGPVQAGPPVLHYVHADHLNTPRAITNDVQQLVWRWEHQEPFGRSPPEENSSGLGNFEFPLRFPGTYADRETGTLYNYFRDYDPQTGRYVQSDPIGLPGGINTYAYVDNRPTTLTDAYGLWAVVDDAIFAGAGALVGLAGQGIGDLVSGNLSGWERYTAAAVGGAIGGETLLYTANPFLAGAAGGLVANVTAQTLERLSGKRRCFSWSSAAADTAVGTLTGFAPGTGKLLPGITAGRGSYSAVSKQMTTKLRNGQIQNVSPATAAKMLGGQLAEGIPGAGAGGVAAIPLPSALDDCTCQR